VYSLQPILLFASTDVSSLKMCLDTSIVAKSNMGQRSIIFREVGGHALSTTISSKDFNFCLLNYKLLYKLIISNYSAPS
jgi:hypothetical protein